MEFLKRVEHSRKKEFYIHVTNIDRSARDLDEIVGKAADELGIEMGEIYQVAENQNEISDRCTEGMVAYLFGRDYMDWLIKARREGEHTAFKLENPEDYSEGLEDIDPSVLEVLEEHGFIEPLESPIEELDELISDTFRTILGIHIPVGTIEQLSDRSLSDDALENIQVLLKNYNESGSNEGLNLSYRKRIFKEYLRSIGAIE